MPFNKRGRLLPGLKHNKMKICVYASDFDMVLIIAIYQPTSEKLFEAFIS